MEQLGGCKQEVMVAWSGGSDTVEKNCTVVKSISKEGSTDPVDGLNEELW